MSDEKFTLIEHLDELRNRIIKSIVVVVICAVFLYNYIDVILASLVKPIGKLVFLTPAEAFTTNIKIALFCGLFLSLPFVLYQIWQFISLALNLSEKKHVLIFVPFSFLFFLLGGAFGYFVIIPIGIKFLLGYATDFITPMITLSNYISFVMMITLAFGVVFQLPLVILFLTKIGLVTPKFLANKRRHSIVIIFIVAAALTPPDVISQCLMAIPLLVLYEIGIMFSRFAYRPR